MKVEFPKESTWESFYEHLNFKDESTDKGWVDCTCPLPHSDGSKKHASVNVITGNFKCWNTACQERYREILGYKLDSQVLSPREYLIVVEGLDKLEATQRYVEYKDSLPPEILVANNYSKVYRPDKNWTKECEAAFERMSPDIPIIKEYCESRGIKYETLLQFKAGYIPEAPDTDEFIVLPYYYKGVVGNVRCRASDGKKSTPKNAYPLLYNIEFALSQLSNSVILVEGESDCIVTTQYLQNLGCYIPVVGTPGAIFSKEFVRNLQGFERIIVVPQADDAGINLVKSVKKHFTNAVTVTIPFEPLDWGNDVADYLLQHPNSIELLELIPQELNVKRKIYTGLELIEEGTKVIDWLIPNLIERDTKTLLVGEPKVYKTWIALQFMDSLINCTPLMGKVEWTPTKTNLKVMLVEEEGSTHRLGDRFNKVTQGINAERAIFIHRQGYKLDEPKSLLTLCEHITQYKPDLLILDPYQALHSQEENSATGTTLVMDGFNQLMRSNPGMSLIVIHHTTKSDKRVERGSGVLRGAVDQIVVVMREGKSTIKLEFVGRDMPEEETKSLIFKFDSETYKHKPLMFAPTPEQANAVEDDAVLKIFKDNPLIEFTKTQLELLLPPIYKSTLNKHIQRLMNSKSIIRNGNGRKGEPFLFKLSGG